jgi:uncharacterized protein
MSDWSHEARGYLLELSKDECWQVLGSGAFGRIAWVGADRPFVIPVNYTVDGSAIHIRSAAYSTLAQEVDASQVAFQVDNIDTATRSGSTVTAQGRAEIRFAGPRTPTEPSVDVWPSGIKAATIVIDVIEISGRRLTPGG